MDTEQFLARVIPPGNYIAIAYNPHPEVDGSPFAHKFFVGGDYGSAAGMLKWAASKNMDAYHALGSFTMATPDGADARGRTKYKGSRSQANVQNMRCFWIDIDVKRAGDKKAANAVYPDQIAAITWLAGFQKAIGIPRPNLVVSSGYGLHVYWVLEDPMPAVDWMPYGSALKAALVANGYSGDSGLSGDSARILRAPGTVNMKSGTPALVVSYDKMSRGDYPNKLILDALTPFLGAVAPARAGQSATVSTLSGGAPSAALAGAPNMAAAAAANLPQNDRMYEFARIASKCAQVSASMTSNGLGDPRPLWYLGHLSLAGFCTDGASFAHEIGKGDPRYTPAATDAAVAQIAADQARKGHGPPTCNHYEMNGHAGLCQSCPFHGKIKTPLVLGADENDLPNGYRRGKGAVEKWVDTKDGGFWTKLLSGDLYNPVLDIRPQGGYAMAFVYEREGKKNMVRVDEPDLPLEAAALRKYFSHQFITLSRMSAQPFGDFILAWLEHLRDQRREREDYTLPFGWARTQKGTHAGFAVGGTLYRPDGTEEVVPGGDKELIASFTPHGSVTPWEKAAAFVMAGRPDLQVLVAAAFAAPLVKLTGHKGVALSAWSRDSGVGKSSALKVAQSVWSSPNMMSNMDDTPNTIRAKIAQTRVLPHIWDEVRPSKDRLPGLVAMFFELTQGRDKARMNADTTLRPVGQWETMLVLCGNSPLMDHIVQFTGATDAGAQRLFEMHLTHPPSDNSATSQRIISRVEEHFGHAGRTYAKWLAMNFDETDALLGKFTEVVNQGMGAQTAERLHVVAMSTILTGATIANRLNIAVFDVKAIYRLLKETFDKLRLSRNDTLTVNAGTIDLEQVLSLFDADHASGRLTTETVARKGPGGVKVVFPPALARVDIQIAIHDQIMRVSQQALMTWCYKRGYSGTEVINGMIVRWNAVRVRKSLGAGTPFAGGQMPCVDIPLIAPELAEYLGADKGGSAPVPGQQAQALAGNKPRVP